MLTGGENVALLDRHGVNIYYEVVGSGPAIVFTHGFGASSHMFAGTVERLSADHTVITWDIRGHGRSDYPPDVAHYSPQLAVGDIAALLDAVGARDAVIAGHSLGGYLSLAFNLAHPNRVRGLVLIDTGPGYRKPEPARRVEQPRRTVRGRAGAEVVSTDCRAAASSPPMCIVMRPG